MKQGITLKLAAAAAICLAGNANAGVFENDDLKLKGNMSITYKAKPKDVNSFREMFTEGDIHGRLRANFFQWDWKDDAAGMDNKANGLGASLVYKSARFNNFSTTLGLYTSQNAEFWREDKVDIGGVKAGKDTFSRSKVKDGGTYEGNYGMTALGQAYLQYDAGKTSVKAGRQMFETVFTKSNDTKMIPNTFDGITVESKAVPDTKIQAAWFGAQKLRDHEDSHDVIAFDSWYQNDDAGVNKSLTTDIVGTGNDLIILEANNKSVKNLKLKAAYALVPDVVSNLTVEGHYKIPVGDWSITPGVRYMHQMDELGVIGANGGEGVANLKKKGDGYTNADSLDASLFAARVDIGTGGPMKFRVGYSKISDDADIIAPWRGFATGGFTRAMAQYNWNANTKTTMLRMDYDFGKAGMIDDTKFLVRYAMQDFDDKKPGVQADSNVIHMDLVKQFDEGLMVKFRVGLIDADDNIQDINGATKTDVSYNEYRVELNYFF
jgi:hypothetical protein